MITPADCERMLFDDALNCRHGTAVTLRERGISKDQALMAARVAEALLLDIAMVEDNQPEEKSEEHHPGDHVQQRLEAKIDLLLGLVGRLLDRGRNVESRYRILRISHRGACLVLPGTWTAEDTALLCIPAATWLPEPLELPVRILATERADDDENRLWLLFEPMGDTLAESMERYLFRVHRRAIAEERRHR